jgi:peptidyl-prolyl cis-trans isomerase B (cyclophilin B)
MEMEMKTKIRNKRIMAAFIMALTLILCALLAGCGYGGTRTGNDESTGGETPPGAMETPESETGGSGETDGTDGTDGTGKEPTDMTKPVLEITMEHGGVITGELDPEAAPITVANFLKLVDEEFYDGLTFHRIIPGFMIQGGDPLGTGTGGSDEKIKGEFSSNGWDNPVSHKRGVISMARSQSFDSASSQFFITNADAKSLDGDYAAFGVVTSGMEVVDEISAVSTGVNDRPETPVVIKTIRRG